jgi:uncharacterized protein (UPF0332 family)
MTRISDCYERGLLRKVDPSQEKAAASISHAREWVNEARKDLGIGAVRSSLVAVYMGYFHSARAVLYHDGIREKSHYCIGVYLETYVEKKQLEEEWVVLFDHMRGLRQADQYSLDARPTEQEAAAAVEGADRFINRMEELIRDVRKAH